MVSDSPALDVILSVQEIKSGMISSLFAPVTKSARFLYYRAVGVNMGMDDLQINNSIMKSKTKW